jgi:hypothetical protein
VAYPFIRFPKFADFIEDLRAEHQIDLKDLDEPLVKDETTHIAVHYLEGNVDGKTVRYVIDVLDFDERITPSVLRSICARFKLEAESFHSGEARVAEETGDDDI